MQVANQEAKLFSTTPWPPAPPLTPRSRLTLTHPLQVANQEGKYLAKLFSNHTTAPGSHGDP